MLFPVPCLQKLRKAVAEWEKLTEEKGYGSLTAKLQQKQQQVKEQNNRNEHQEMIDRGVGKVGIGVENCSNFIRKHKNGGKIVYSMV